MIQEVPMLELRCRTALLAAEPPSPELADELARRQVKEPGGFRRWS